LSLSITNSVRGCAVIGDAEELQVKAIVEGLQDDRKLMTQLFKDKVGDHRKVVQKEMKRTKTIQEALKNLEAVTHDTPDQAKHDSAWKDLEKKLDGLGLDTFVNAKEAKKGHTFTTFHHGGFHRGEPQSHEPLVLRNGRWRQAETYNELEAEITTEDLSLPEAIKDVHEIEEVEVAAKRFCATSVTNIFSRMGYLATALNGLFYQCGHFKSPTAFCAADISVMFAGISRVASAISEISLTCTDMGELLPLDLNEWARRLEAVNDTTTDNVDNAERMLRELKAKQHHNSVPEAAALQGMFKNLQETTNKMHDQMEEHQDEKKKEAKAKAGRSTALTACVASAWSATAHLASGLDPTLMIHSCVQDYNELHCAASATHFISTFGWVAEGISNAVGVCPKGARNDQPFCSAAISRLAVGLADIASGGILVGKDCDDALKENHKNHSKISTKK